MSQEERINRDLLFKICFMYFANHILKILGIDEEIVEISPTELIGLEKTKKPKIFNNFLDFAAITKSGKIILFEFKKNSLRTTDLEQSYRYFKHVYCKNKSHVDFIIITISDKGIIDSYKNKPLIFCPQIIKTKTINKQKDLSTLRDKFKDNCKINSYDCSLMIALPLFKTKESEDEITEEMCRYIKEKKDCIPEDELENIVPAMYLNIIEYTKNEKHDELMEMIGLAEKIQGIISEMKDKARNEGRNEERTDIIKRLIENFSSDDDSDKIIINKATLLNMLQK